MMQIWVFSPGQIGDSSGYLFFLIIKTHRLDISTTVILREVNSTLHTFA